MFDTPITIPDRISTLELSKIWLYKAFQNLNTELEPEVSPESDNQTDDLSDDGSGDRV